jgi:hypothetical protein
MIRVYFCVGSQQFPFLVRVGARRAESTELANKFSSYSLPFVEGLGQGPKLFRADCHATHQEGRRLCALPLGERGGEADRIGSIHHCFLGLNIFNPAMFFVELQPMLLCLLS